MHPLITRISNCTHWMQKLKAALVGAQGYQRFPLSKAVVGKNIALEAVPAYRASTYPVSHPTSFSPKFSKSSTMECVLSSESIMHQSCTYGRDTFYFALIRTFRGGPCVKLQVSILPYVVNDCHLSIATALKVL